jgi:hypothetical protein
VPAHPWQPVAGWAGPLHEKQYMMKRTGWMATGWVIEITFGFVLEPEAS